MPKFEQPKAESERERKTREQNERLHRTVTFVAGLARENEIQDDVFLAGGLTFESNRKHDDVDIIVKGKKASDILEQAIPKTGKYDRKDDASMEHTSRQDFVPKREANLGWLDVRHVVPEEINGVMVWKYVMPKEVADIIGKPLAIPDSAFETGEELDFDGEIIHPLSREYTYLTKRELKEEKHQQDVEILEVLVDMKRVRQMEEEIERSGITLLIPQDKDEEIQEALRNN